MSKDAALSFLKKVSEDSTLQEKLLAFAAQEGYQFTVEELSEAELEGAAGGLFVAFPKVENLLGVKSATPKLTFPKMP